MNEPRPNNIDPRNIDLFIDQKSQVLNIPADTYKRILMASVDPSLEDIGNLDVAIQSSNYPDIKAIAHRLKGVYLNLRIEELAQPMKEIDTLAREEGNLDEANSHFLRFQEFFFLLKNAL